MDLPTILGAVAAGIALVLTPIWLYFIIKGARSLSDIREILRRPPGDSG